MILNSIVQCDMKTNWEGEVLRFQVGQPQGWLHIVSGFVVGRRKMSAMSWGSNSGWVAQSLGCILTETRVLRYCIGMKTMNSTNKKAKQDGMDPCPSRGWGKCFVKVYVICAVKEKFISF